MDAAITSALEEFKSSTLPRIRAAAESEVATQLAEVKADNEECDKLRKELADVRAHLAQTQAREKAVELRERAMSKREDALKVREDALRQLEDSRITDSALSPIPQGLANTPTPTRSSMSLFGTPSRYNSLQQGHGLTANKPAPVMTPREEPSAVQLKGTVGPAAPIAAVCQTSTEEAFRRSSVASSCGSFPSPRSSLTACKEPRSSLTVCKEPRSSLTVCKESRASLTVCKESCGSASKLKDLFESKARSQSRKPPRTSWTEQENQVALPDGSGTASFRAHEQPFKAAKAGNPAPPPPQKRSLADLLKADEEKQAAFESN